MTERKTITIEIDNEVFDFLKEYAEPFIDTPNDVLRKLLLVEKRAAIAPSRRHTTTDHTVRTLKIAPVSRVSTEEFVRKIMTKDFGDNYSRIGNFQYMFRVSNKYVYFQNFNKPNDKLWYRISESALRQLRGNPDNSIIYFTNPSENYAYKIPFPDVERQRILNGWDKSHLEVNIDSAISRWTELDWNIKSYLHRYPV